MISKQNKKQKKLIRLIIFSPIRLLKKAADLYVKSMTNVAGHGNVMMTCPVTHISGFGVKTPKSSGGADVLRELIRVASMKRSFGREMESEARKNGNYEGVGRSYSVGNGRLQRIDEDKCCEFDEDVVVVWSRSRTYAVPNRNFVSHW